MEITGKVHCFFEQSGTFKNEFIKMGIPAEDYDIQNNFHQTDHVIDLFKEIETEYGQDKTRQGKTVFSTINACQDLIIAFFPCIYFETMQMTYYSIDALNNSFKPYYERVRDAEERLQKRTQFHSLLYKLVYICTKNNFRLIIENPATKPHYLIDTQNFPKPQIVDRNRMLRGDYFKKPTAYWFFCCEPTYGFSEQNDKEQKIVQKCKKGKCAGLCSEERSMISSDYARNWICDFVLGKKQNNLMQSELF